MYSDTTELDGEDEDVASWSSKRTIDENRNDESTSCSVREFGDFVDNHGWIQCRSKSYPGRDYFYNTHSGCNTWYRPISRYVNIPFISIRRMYHQDDVSANNIELLSVSDNENEPAAKRDGDKSLTPVPDVIARCYYTPHVDLTSDADDSCSSSIEGFASEYHYKKEQIDKNNNDEDIADEKSDSETGCTTLCATNFLETEFFVGENEVNMEKINRIFDSSTNDDISSATTQSPSAQRFVYDVPRLKKISFEDQLIKPRRTRVSNHVARGPRKIICDMYGVRTISYDLPTPDQVRAEVGVKTSTLSESDSDVSEPPLQDAKTTLSFESEWRDIEKNLHQPLLSDPSSSPSSRSDTNSSATSWSTSSTACSCSSCTTCSSCK
ncbi:uncharacterized protein [Polyergus mexicanus]|uniref:uncharacterized protein n=1 Tax=Polyergus mexicanus TaxID=615972 RepID=UPI0038B446DD